MLIPAGALIIGALLSILFIMLLVPFYFIFGADRLFSSKTARMIAIFLLGLSIPFLCTSKMKIGKIRGQRLEIVNYHLKGDVVEYLDQNNQLHTKQFDWWVAFGHEVKVFYDAPAAQPQYVEWTENNVAYGDVIVHLHKIGG